MLSFLTRNSVSLFMTEGGGKHCQRVRNKREERRFTYNPDQYQEIKISCFLQIKWLKKIFVLHFFFKLIFSFSLIFFLVFLTELPIDYFQSLLTVLFLGLRTLWVFNSNRITLQISFHDLLLIDKFLNAKIGKSRVLDSCWD